MRVLAITHQFPTPYQPTYSTYNRQQFGELAELHEMQVIRPIPWTLAATQRRGGKWQGPGPVAQGKIPVYFPVFYYPPKVGSHLYGQFFEWSVRGVVTREVAAFKPDVLLATWAHPDGWATWRLARRAGLPVVLKVTGADVLAYATGRRRQSVAEALCGVDAVIAVSQDLARHVVQLGASPARVHVVPEGVSTTLFSPGDQAAARARLGLPSAGPLLVFVGSLLASKGVLDLLAACALLRDRGVAFGCRIVGHGADAGRVAQVIEQQALADRVVCAGVRPHAEVADWFRASDVVVLPSYVEGLPNVLREALACGRPFVATTVGGIPEIADPSHSRLVSPGAVPALADALAQMLAQPLRVDPSVVGRLNISWQESARLLSEHLRAVVAARSAATV